MYTHYYPFGMLQPNRGYQGTGYRYGFNGKEKDDEVKGSSGTQYDYGFRIYDPRLGKFLSVDPLTSSYPSLSTYAFAANTPIMAIDLDGLEAAIRTVSIWVNSNGQQEENEHWMYLGTDYFETDPQYGDKGILTIVTNVDTWEETTNYISGVEVKPGWRNDVIDINNYIKGIPEKVGDGIVDGLKSFDRGFNSIKGDSYGEWEGQKAQETYTKAVGETGQQLQNIAPILGPAAPIAKLLGTGLECGAELMQTCADIETKGLSTGLENGAVRAAALLLGETLDYIPKPKGAEAIIEGFKPGANAGIDMIKDGIIQNNDPVLVTP